MKLLPALLAGLVGALVPASLYAVDSIRLRDGTVIEGKILSESPQEVTIEFGGSIKETRTLTRSEILSVDKETPDEAAYEKLEALLPTEDLLSADDYRALLEGDLSKFAVRFPDSKLNKSVDFMIEQVKTELARAEAGGIKIDGVWLSGEEAAKDPYNHEARVLAAKVRKAAEGLDFAAALNHFEKLEKDYFYSTVYADARTEVLSILPKFDAVLDRLQRENAIITKEREANLKTMDFDVRERTEKAFADQMATFQARREADREQKMIWLPISKWDAASLEEARKTVASETERLTNLDLTKHKTAATMLSASQRSLAEGDLTSAASQLAIARANDATGDAVMKLDERIKSAVKAAEAAKVAATLAAQAAAGTQGETDPDADPAADPDVDPDADPAKTTKTPAEDKPPKATASTGGGTKTAEATDSPSWYDDDDDPADEEEVQGGIPLKVLLIILAGVMVLVTVLAKVFGNKGDDTT